eukprot:8476839-Pyramimonas_sp.AAC.1
MRLACAPTPLSHKKLWADVTLYSPPIPLQKPKTKQPRPQPSYDYPPDCVLRLAAPTRSRIIEAYLSLPKTSRGPPK